MVEKRSHYKDIKYKTRFVAKMEIAGKKQAFSNCFIRFHKNYNILLKKFLLQFTINVNQQRVPLGDWDPNPVLFLLRAGQLITLLRQHITVHKKG